MAVGDDFVIVEREVSASDVAKIRSFLSPTDFDGEGSELQKHLAAHVPGTGKWLFDNDRYKRWHSSHDTGLLWIKGTAGTGKSVIAAQLIRTLQESEASTPVLFFFFRHIIQSNCYPKSAARDLLYQALRHSRRLQGQLRKIVDSYANIDQVPFRELWQPLLDAVRAMPKLYVVTDALDEIQGGPDEFLAGLMELGRIKPDSVKMIVTSRPLPQLEAVLFGASVVSIRLNGAVLAEDISEYVDQRLNSQPQRQFSKDERLLIHRALCGDGQGLFLHARLTLDELLQSSETDSLESQLSRLSSDLRRVYRNLLNEYARRAGISSRFQTIILQWATHSVRPLRLTELAAMVTSLDNGGGLAANQETKATIRTCCGPLLELLENGTLQVIHHSFTEFLCDAGPIDHTAAPELYEYNELKVPSLSSSVDVHRSLASICLDYLTSGCLDYDPPDVLDRLARKAKEEDVVLRHQFLLYAANHWLDHASKCDDFDAGFFSKMDSFFVPENPAFRNWFRIYLESSRISQLRHSGSPLHIASFAGLSTYVRYLLAKGKAPDCLDHDFQTPLMWAAMGGHPGVAAVLLEYNAQTTLYDRDGKSPIDIAVENRHPGVLRRLLAASKMETMNLVERRRYPWVVPRATGTFLRDSPLFLACKVGSVEVMRVLMEFIEPRSEAAIGLCWAARHRQRELLRFMLQYPEVATNINQKDDNGNTALFIAAHFQDYASIRILCKNGANASQTSDDIDAPKERPAYEPESKVACHAVCRSHMLTPLHALAGFWNRRYENSVSGFAGTKAARLAVELLIEAGCDINARDSQGKTPLFGWHTDYSDSLLPTLLHCGADARARDNEGGTPLHIMWYRSSQIPSLTMLLQAGADINAARLSDGCTPINAAKHRIREESLNLVAYGADPNSQDRAGNTALHYLCRRGSLTYLRSEWLEVADPKIKNKDGETCLHWLGDCSDARETLKSFIERGVDLEARDALGRTVLLAACARIEADLGSALLEFGADVAAVDYQGKSGLHLLVVVEPSSKAEKKRLLDELIQAGGNPDCVDYSGNTALHDAAAWDARSQSDAYSAMEWIFERARDSNALMNRRNHQGLTALHLAAARAPKSDQGRISSSRKALSGLSFLLNKGADVHAVDHNGTMAIHFAARSSETNVWKLKLAGADLRARTARDLTPLHFAAGAGQSGVVHLLCKTYNSNGWSIDEPDMAGQTPLHHAARSGSLEAVDILLQSGAIPSSRDNLKKTPLHAAAEYQLSSKRVLERCCCKHGESSQRRKRCNRCASGDDESNWNEMRFTISSEDDLRRAPDIVRLLLLAGADPTARDKSNATAFDTAQLLGSQQVTDVFWEQTISPSLSDESCFSNEPVGKWPYLRPQQTTPSLQCATLDPTTASALLQRALLLNDKASVKVLVDSGADPTIADASGDPSTPLHTAVLWGLTSMVEILSRNVADWAALSPSLLRTALERERPNMLMVELLVKLGVDINANDAPSPILTLADGRFCWHPTALEYLCDQGADLKICDENGRTPLHRSVRLSRGDPTYGFWQEAALDVLLSRGADVNALCIKDGKTPLHHALASKRGRPVIQKLLANGADPNLGKYSPIFTAIISEDLASLVALLEAGANCNLIYQPESKSYYTEDPNRETPLLVATCPERRERLTGERAETRKQIIELLLKHGADPMHKFRNDGTTVLHEIALLGGLITPILAVEGINLEMKDDLGRTPLILACGAPPKHSYAPLEERERCALELIHAEANIDVADNEGSTPLHNAVESKLVQTVSLLLEHGASVTLKDHSGATPLFYALGCDHPDKLFEMVAILKDKCPDIMQETHPRGKTPLHLLAPWLLEFSTDPDGMNKVLEDEEGQYMEYGDTDDLPNTSKQLADFQTLYQEFIDLGWSREARDDLGNTPIFYYAARSKRHGSPFPADPRDTRKMFTDHDITAVNNEGDTLLHVVARRRRIPESGSVTCELFKQLMELGLDPHKENNIGSTPLDIASACGNDFIMELFAEK